MGTTKMMIQVVKVLCRAGAIEGAAHIPLSRVQVGNDRRFEHNGGYGSELEMMQRNTELMVEAHVGSLH